MDYFDLGDYSRSVTTTSDEAQTWFDRGLRWTYGFNHEEAAACFRTQVPTLITQIDRPVDPSLHGAIFT